MTIVLYNSLQVIEQYCIASKFLNLTYLLIFLKYLNCFNFESIIYEKIFIYTSMRNVKKGNYEKDFARNVETLVKI